MPVRINLKELFAADVQTIFTDKINFNFNKMLELGVGEIGERGITGPGGSAGPGGIPGPEGQRGNKWFVGTGDPNGQSFTGLIDGDFYLDTTTSSIWQYSDISPGIWTLVADISAIVINFLENLGSPFVRGVGDASPLDDRFIVFQHRSNNDFERTADGSLGNSSDNDMLLLNNWNEHLNGGGLALSNFPANTDELFNALQFISVDHTLDFGQGRYHIELGSLYQSTFSASNVISSLTHNLKIRYSIDTSAGISYPISNVDGVFISNFSLTNPPTEPFTTIDKNAIFEFWTPKFNDDPPGPIVQQNMKFAMGAQEGLSDFFPTLIPMDGFVIQHFGISALEIGINGIPSDSLSNLPVVFDDVPMAIIDGTDDTSLFINKEIIQTGGDIQNVPTTPVEFLRKDVAGTWTFNITDKQRIFSNGENIFMTQSQWSNPDDAVFTDPGRLTIYETSTPTNPKKIHEITTDSITAYSFVLPLAPAYDNHGHIENGPYSPDEIPLSGVTDVTFAGKYGYLVRSLAIPPFAPNDIFAHQFEIFEMDSRGNKLHMIASLNHANMRYAKRVKLNGQYAFVMSAENANLGGPTTNNLTSLLLCEPFVDPIGQPDYTIKQDGSANLPKANFIASTTLGPVFDDWLDFDIYNDKAYVLKKEHFGLTDILKLYTYNIADPSNMFSFSSGTPVIAEWNIHFQSPGAVKVDSQHAYVVCGHNNSISVGGNFAILSLSEEQHLGPPPVVVSTMEFEPYLIDIEISGDYAYVLARMTATGRATIIIIDITDKAAPFLVAMDNTGLTECMNPSSMTLRGKNIYVAAAGALPGNADQGMYIFNIDGIKSSSANIGNIASNEIKVSGKVSTGQNLDVGASAAIGQNLTVHGDICVGGKINVDQYSFGMVPIGTVVPWVGNWSSFPFTSPPDGWLVCDGSVIDETTYPELYELLGGLAGPHPFGGPGVLPDMASPHGKVIAGAGGASGAQGDDVGQPTKTLGFNDLPAHTHDLTGVVASLSGSTGDNSVGHNHSYTHTTGATAHNTGNASTDFNWGVGATTGGQSANHTHDLSTGSATLSGNTGNNTTAGNSFSLYQPTLVINHIIYAGESI